MILSWMFYALIIGLLVSFAAWLAERAASFLRLPARQVWLAAIILCAAWPLAALALRLAAARAEQTMTPNIVPFASVVESVSRAAAARAGSALIVRLDQLSLLLWAVVSAGLIWRQVSASKKLRKLRQGWQKETIDGKLVRVARECGPAVVGTREMEIVIPEWTLSFDTHLRALILRHEDEHRAAGDPLLLQIARITAALLPWHLALHWQMRRLRLAVELDCDARVLQVHPDADRYAKLLLTIAQMRSLPRNSPALAMMEDSSQLERRILAMKRVFVRRRLLHAGLAVAAAILVIVVACDVVAPTAPGAVASQANVPSAEGPYYAYEVGKMAKLLYAPPPGYPNILRQTRQNGKVLIQVVIAASGHADMATFKVVKSSNALFDAEVKKVFPRYEFAPAEIAGRKVPMYVQIPFEFKLDSGQ